VETQNGLSPAAVQLEQTLDEGRDLGIASLCPVLYLGQRRPPATWRRRARAQNHFRRIEEQWAAGQ
ncbi:MAG: hypothetical protein QF893_24280, partial [Alphaproteobacteria bacterium]|nr:hypothetical protein [Alphaproteobacteria bacterium]